MIALPEAGWLSGKPEFVPCAPRDLRAIAQLYYRHIGRFLIRRRNSHHSLSLLGTRSTVHFNDHPQYHGSAAGLTVALLVCDEGISRWTAGF